MTNRGVQIDALKFHISVDDSHILSNVCALCVQCTHTQPNLDCFSRVSSHALVVAYDIQESQTLYIYLIYLYLFAIDYGVGLIINQC